MIKSTTNTNEVTNNTTISTTSQQKQLNKYLKDNQPLLTTINNTIIHPTPQSNATIINLKLSLTPKYTTSYVDLKHLIQHYDTSASSKNFNTNNDQSNSFYNKSLPSFMCGNRKLTYQRKAKVVSINSTITCQIIKFKS